MVRPSPRAVPYAAALARATNGRLILTQAYVDGPGREQAEAELAYVAAQLEQHDIPVGTDARFGDPGKVIKTVCEEEHARVLVMSTHGRSGIGRWVYGSVADEVLRHATVPVLLVPPHTVVPWPGNTGSRPMRVLVPLDGSDLSEAALPAAQELASVLKASLVLMQVVPLPVATYPYDPGLAYYAFDPEAQLAEARAYLESVAQPLVAAGMDVQVHTESGFPAPAIAAAAREKVADVIVMATHGRSGLARLMLGSTTTGVVQQASVPVLLVRPLEVRNEERETAVQATREPVAVA